MEKYLEEVRQGISVLNASIVENEINKIKNELTLSIEKGMNENEILKNYPSAKDKIREILQNNGLNSGKNNFFVEKFQELFRVINKVVDVMSKNDLKSNAKIISDILILIILICLLKIPFILVRNVGDSLISYINFPLALKIWGIAIEFVYIIVGIMVFINVFTKWFNKLKVNPNAKVKEKVVSEMPKEKENVKMGEDLTSISLEDKSQK